MAEHGREGGLGAPTRHPLNQDDPKFWDEDDLNKELERVYDICHTCRRCVSLCNSFPTLFDLIDNSDTMEVDGIDVADYTKVVDQCYLCDLCYLTKCPYVPPHEWNLDFPHLMLRAKAIKFKKGTPNSEITSSPAPTWLAKWRHCHWSTRWSTAGTKTARCAPHWTAASAYTNMLSCRNITAKPPASNKR